MCHAEDKFMSWLVLFKGFSSENVRMIKELSKGTDESGVVSDKWGHTGLSVVWVIHSAPGLGLAAIHLDAKVDVWFLVKAVTIARFFSHLAEL